MRAQELECEKGELGVEKDLEGIIQGIAVPVLIKIIVDYCKDINIVAVGEKILHDSFQKLGTMVVKRNTLYIQDLCLAPGGFGSTRTPDPENQALLHRLSLPDSKLQGTTILALPLTCRQEKAKSPPYHPIYWTQYPYRHEHPAALRLVPDSCTETTTLMIYDHLNVYVFSVDGMFLFVFPRSDAVFPMLSTPLTPRIAPRSDGLQMDGRETSFCLDSRHLVTAVRQDYHHPRNTRVCVRLTDRKTGIPLREFDVFVDESFLSKVASDALRIFLSKGHVLHKEMNTENEDNNQRLIPTMGPCWAMHCSAVAFHGCDVIFYSIDYDSQGNNLYALDENLKVREILIQDARGDEHQQIWPDAGALVVTHDRLVFCGSDNEQCIQVFSIIR